VKLPIEPDSNKIFKDVINFSIRYEVDENWATLYDAKNIEYNACLLHLTTNMRRIFVYGSGNDASMSEIGTLGPKLLASNPESSPYLIRAIAISDDGRYLTYFTVQPGDDEALQMHSICAVGENLTVASPLSDGGISEAVDQGTSLSTPIVSAAAVLVLSHIRKKFTGLVELRTLRMKPEETLVEVRSRSDVQIDGQIWV